MPSPRQSLLIFLKAPVPGKVKTRLAQDIGPMEAARIYRAMADNLQQEIALLKNTRIIWVYEASKAFPDLNWLGLRETPFWRQSRGNLGQRLKSAISRAFQEGHDSVTVIGTDCPSLDARRIRAAFQTLNQNDLVLGPAEDGGYYLIAMRKYYPKIFSSISWSTDRVLLQTREKAKDLGLRTHLLPQEFDVDTIDDLRRVKCGII